MAPNGMANGNTEWKVSQAEFKGFVKAKLEDIQKAIQNQNQTCVGTRKEFNNQVGDLDGRIDKLEQSKSYALGFASAVGFLAGLVGSFLSRIWR